MFNALFNQCLKSQTKVKHKKTCVFFFFLHKTGCRLAALPCQLISAFVFPWLDSRSPQASLSIITRAIQPGMCLTWSETWKMRPSSNEPQKLSCNSLTLPSLSVLHNGKHLSLIVRKPVFGVSDQVPHKPGCAITEYSRRLEILDLGSNRIVLSV